MAIDTNSWETSAPLGWRMNCHKSNCNLELTNGHYLKVVHVNRVRYRKQPDQTLDPSIPMQSAVTAVELP